MDIEDIEEEVEVLADELDDFCDNSQDADRLYLGTQIFFSPMVYNADIMFLGINPGPGYYNYYNRKVRNFYPLEEHEYLNLSYTLAGAWRSIFENLGRMDLLENSFKSNCFYFSTETTKSLEQLKSLAWNYRNIDLDKKSEAWTDALLEEVNPKLLICEGKAVKKMLSSWYKYDFTDYDEFSGYLENHGIEVMIAERMSCNLKNKARIEKSLRKYIRDLVI